MSHENVDLVQRADDIAELRSDGGRTRSACVAADPGDVEFVIADGPAPDICEPTGRDEAQRRLRENRSHASGVTSATWWPSTERSTLATGCIVPDTDWRGARQNERAWTEPTSPTSAARLFHVRDGHRAPTNIVIRACTATARSPTVGLADG